MTYNAHVTVDAGHHLTAGSTVVVSDPGGHPIASAPVPVSAGERGGVLFWRRVGVALERIGWRPIHIWPSRPDPGFTTDEPGIVRFTAVPKES
jgi:hypothetical protein